MLTNKCVESTCKKPDETYLTFSPLFISYGLNLYLLKKLRLEKPLYERYIFNPIIKIITEFTENYINDVKYNIYLPQRILMDLLIYILAYPLMWIISRLNFQLLYVISDVLYYLLYYIFSYRKRVVKENLKLAFPKMLHKDRLRIEKKYYRFLCDIFLESFKSMNISKKEINIRYNFKNLELLDELHKKNKNLILMAGHYCSWEWVFNLNNNTNYQVNAIYKKLSNKYFDNWAKDIRSKYGCHMITTKDTFKEILKHTKTKNLNLYGFASDQSPRKNKKNHWGMFLNNYVPIHTGAEIIAKKYNMAVAYMNVKRVKRGYYEIYFKTITEQPKKFKNFEITDKFIRLLENQIKEKPEYYTWTHRRFKHRKVKIN